MATITNQKNVVTEIGLLEEPDNSWILQSRFFPSKVGGKPAWLNLEQLPDVITCSVCKDPSSLLCQVYAPLEGPAYHRTIYLFICRNPNCCIPNKNGNLKILRCQLPRTNKFYPEEEPIGEPTWHPECTVDNFSTTCCLCGQWSKFKCKKCGIQYCSSQHQIRHWHNGHKKQCGKETKTNIIDEAVLFQEFEIVTTSEKNEDESEPKTDQERMEEFIELVKNGEAGTMPNIPPNLLEEFSALSVDKYFETYHKTIKSCPDQILRFCRGGSPLFISKPEFESTDIPDCEWCGGKRVFEFQILSTLLNDLELDDLGKSVDWGTLICYTCENSCEGGPPYKPEFIVKQDIV